MAAYKFTEVHCSVFYPVAFFKSILILVTKLFAFSFAGKINRLIPVFFSQYSGTIDRTGIYFPKNDEIDFCFDIFDFISHVVFVLTNNGFKWTKT